MPTHDPLHPNDAANTPTDGEINDEDLEGVVGGGPPGGPLGTSTPRAVSPRPAEEDDTGSLFI